jgi:hypothetical protein
VYSTTPLSDATAKPIDAFSLRVRGTRHVARGHLAIELDRPAASECPPRDVEEDGAGPTFLRWREWSMLLAPFYRDGARRSKEWRVSP